MKISSKTTQITLDFILLFTGMALFGWLAGFANAQPSTVILVRLIGTLAGAEVARRLGMWLAFRRQNTNGEFPIE